MKFREIFRFELAYQVRRLPTWLFFAVIVAVTFMMVRENYLFEARSGDFLVNGTFVITIVTFWDSLIWLLVAASVAGDAATRDVQTRMHPLTYTAPVSKTAYLGGRFLAAFAVNALVLLAAPAGIVLALTVPGLQPADLGPFRPAAYLTAYGFIALPNAFVATAIQFSLAARNGKAQASYLGSLLLFIAAYIAGPIVARVNWELGTLVDPIGVIGILSELPEAWTPIEKNTRLLALEGSLLANRLLWIGIALGALALTHLRFRFGHPAASARRRGFLRRRAVQAPVQARAGTGLSGSAPISVPRVPRTFGAATRTRQTLAIARASFRQIARSRSGGVVLVVLLLLTLLTVPQSMEQMGVPLFPRTDHVIRVLTAPLTDLASAWVIIPMLTIFYAGELVWREREAGLSEITDAAPVPEGVLFLGKFLGLGLVLAALMALLTGVGVLVQALWGHGRLEVGLLLQALFGLQLAEYLLFALLALLVHVLVDQKATGHLAAFIAYAVISRAPLLGVEHHLLVYGSGPAWSYTDMRGFGPFLGPWLWFRLYWGAWALLLAVVARLLWVRGRERDAGARLRVARRRFTRRTAGAAAAAGGLVLALGGFIFYNTNVLNEYAPASERVERSAEYERRYGRYEAAPQPALAGTSLHVEIHPRRRTVDIRGTYRLVNRGAVPIDSIHLATVPEVETGAIAFDRPAARVLADEALGHRIYALREPLRPGDSLRLGFRVRFAPRGFRNGGVDDAVVANGTFFSNHEWLPAVGYQPHRELGDAADRRAHGLPARPETPSLHDAAARGARTGTERIAFEAVVGTDADQVAVAPGALRRAWRERGRRYFRYSTDAPIRNDYAFFSARYAVHQARWNGVAIQIFHHPGHAATVDRMVRGVRASLDRYTRLYGPYPYSHLRLVEHPGQGMGMHSAPVNIQTQEGFTLFNPASDPRELDIVFWVVAHEVAHQWWGNQLTPARVEGAALLTESLATYSALGVVEEAFGPAYLRRHLGWLRIVNETPRSRAALPLLRADDPYLVYRRGPFALYTLGRYIGADRVDAALRGLLRRHGSGAPPLPTSLDLYRELQAVTPDSLRSLLRDLFARNTFWELETEEATARRTAAGVWEVALKVRARKGVVDSAGVETPVPVDDRVEIAVFGAHSADGGAGEPMYLGKHHIRGPAQTITVTVPRRPVRAGIDPDQLLTDSGMGDNIRPITIRS